MSVDLEEPRESIATGRSWRDLPPSPPASARIGQPAATTPAIDEPASKVNRRFIAVVSLALLVGVAVGLWSPWSTDPGSAAAAPAPTTSLAPPDGIDSLPESIVPQLPDELRDPPGAVDPFDLFDETPFADRFPGIQNDVSLIELGALPNGYRSIGSIVSRSGDDIRHQIRLLGPDGIATVRGEREAGVEVPDEGDVVDINGREGRMVVGTTTSITWMIDDVLVTVEAPVEAGEETLLEIARTVEVAE